MLFRQINRLFGARKHNAGTFTKLQLIGPEEVINDLKSNISKENVQIIIEQEGIVRDSNYQSMDLITILSLTLGVYSAAFSPLAPMIRSALRSKSGKWIEIRTPVKTVRIEDSDKLTERQIMNIIKQLRHL